MSQNTAVENSSDKRIYQIDLFRLLAALSVVLFHYLFRGYMADNMSSLRFPEAGKYFKYGYLGVDLFFIISGFVITLSIKSRSLGDFFISRTSRLYPSYWLSIIITSVVIMMFGLPRFEVTPKQIAINMTMFPDYLNVPAVDSAYWSLFVEMKFYIFIIGTYLVLNKIREIKLDYLIYTWLALSVAYVFLHHIFLFRAISFFLILEWSSYFIAGMIFYQVFKNRLSAKYILLLGITMAISIFQAIARTKDMELHYNTSFSSAYVSVYIIIFYALMLLVSCGKLKAINSPKLIKVGLLTYPLYLLHQNIGYIIFNNWGSESNKYIVLCLTILLMLFVSYLISRFYEPRVANYIKTKLRLLLGSYRQKRG